MRRGGHGYNLQAPWRQRDDPDQSSIPLEQVEAFGFKRLVLALAALSLALSIVGWHSRHHVSLLTTRPSGFLFPLYGYSYRQFLNASNDLEGRIWSGRRRGLRQMEASGPLFQLREAYYITMKLGVPPQEFNFFIDTGSRNTWVNCKIPGHQSNIRNLGPHGKFQSTYGSIMKCTGESSHLCYEIQEKYKQPCDGNNRYECLLSINYIDSLNVRGVFIIDSITLQMQDKSEVNVRSYFGCVTKKAHEDIDMKFEADGIIGMGNCKKTLADQWVQKKLISHNVLGFCIAKTLKPKIMQVGFVSFGIDFKQKSKESNPSWARLIVPPRGVKCAYTTNLLFILFQDDIITTQRQGIPIIIDTESKNTFLESKLYDSLINLLDLYATNKGYVEVEDDHNVIVSERRLCWRPPSKFRKSDKSKSISPINDFPKIKFAIEGTFDAAHDDQILYLIVKPNNYLKWKAVEKRLCVNIFKDDHDDPVQNFGAMMLKEHLFVLDFNNQRLRWQRDTCELP